MHEDVREVAVGRRARALGGGVLVVVLAAGAYGVADAVDVVPGVLTLAPVPSPPPPDPTAPGAVVPDALPAVLPDLDATAPVPAVAALQAQVDALVTDPRLGPSVGVVVADAATGQDLAVADPGTARIPASTQKLLTAVAALSVLDPASTTTTSVVRGDGDTLVLVGGGDMMLAAGAGDPTAVEGHAGLGDLADQVARALTLAGTTTVRLAVDDDLFAGPTVNAAWGPADVAAGYAAPVTALAVDTARLTDAEYAPRSPDPSLAAGRVLAERLAERGITVTGPPTRAAAPDGAPVLGEVASAPLADVVHHFLDTSDNTITEVVARQVALQQGLPASFEGSTQAVLRVLAGLGVDVGTARLVDASGLAAGSALSARLLSDLLLHVLGSPDLREVATGMPVAGLTGTLADRYRTSEARGLVRAKTGSLPDVTALAGTVVDDDGRLLVFAVLADRTPGAGQLPPRAAIDVFVGGLAGCGCS
ncbi:D-alanyl-D-alanine carboxypeptidase/D-alanyl-D-alanine endopeptidase [Cellulomonas marina]|uniref:D-alanyl-D-alanine carboxypeptidase / D-alanyl-D-alanine-endopeptidase (Penicillin-binding protein 4) n=1 Tax=Cellulomonas marina TaxID=988821 RepID=A0A1I0WMG6_9CELL|nr:D-alanyl-D-alanine carboxypeptidase/D-alanyl-D-alanine-endopeptidase [Cellulomonas marina]GIG27753.1 D-alanyl-D-alanine carboxypeptidase [Cellulomonas marina]SFA89939.1 D-alanyl-D-alanine carboxypeptidase / D-alanyl-D-alanine-endopeptidase (penicillin-binding protein 4) [Cellulomonas marina]